MKLRVLPRAARDLAEIHSYIKVENAPAADATMVQIKKLLRLIASRAEIGRPSREAHILEWSLPIMPFLIPSRVRGEAVDVLRVFHTSRQRPSKWTGE